VLRRFADRSTLTEHATSSTGESERPAGSASRLVGVLQVIQSCDALTENAAVVTLHESSGVSIISICRFDTFWLTVRILAGRFHAGETMRMANK
jgi:hypothetical protein